MNGDAAASRYDLAVIGGGVMGCAAALAAAQGGMRAIVIEKADLCSGASGVNAGTLSLQIKRVKLMPYALRGHELWREAGDAVGFRRSGGLTLAFTSEEAGRLESVMTQKREAGAPISFKTPAEVAALEPGLSRRIVLASFCPEDGYANASLTGTYYRRRLAAQGVALAERAPVSAIERRDGCFELATASGGIRARRILIACGAWSKDVAALLGLDLPIRVRINTVSVTERHRPIVTAVIGHATGLLTLKQKPNGTVLIGGGWQGRGLPKDGRGEVVPETLLTNLRLAQYALPALAAARLTRVWTGFEANVADFFPLAGALPGIEDAFILVCVRGGYTIGPYIGALMGELILGREPRMPLFDPARLLDAPALAPAPNRLSANA